MILQFALLGLGLGAVYALAGSGLVLIYRGSGVLNFAHGAFALIGALAFFELHVELELPAAVAVVLALVVSAAAGTLMHLLVMRPLRHAPPLTRVIATLGVMVLVQQASRIIFGTEVRLVPGFLPEDTVGPVQGVTVGADRLWLLAIAAVITVVLWAVYRYTRFGAVTSAVAENERAAQLAGHSPDRVAGINWTVGAALAGLAGILIVPISGLDIDTLIMLIIPALAAGVVASFSSFPVAFAAALAVGVLQSEITNYVTATGWGQAVPFLVVVVVLVVRGRGLPLRSHVNELLPDIGSGRLRPRNLAIALVLAAALILLLPADWSDAFTSTMIGAIICISLVVVLGYAGQLSLAQFAFAGLAGYVAARLAAGLGLPFPLALVIGVVAAVPAGILVGLPALRTRGIQLAIVTFGLAYALQTILFQSVPLTGGLEGTVVESPTLFGLDLDPVRYPERYALVCLVALALAAVVASNIRRGRSGRRLVAVRANERAAASLGISVFGAKLYSFALSAGIAGLGGVLLAFRSTFVDFTQFTVLSSIATVINTVIGGIGYLLGGLMGGMSTMGGVTPKIFSEIVPSAEINEWVTLVLALLLIPTLIQFPDGLMARATRYRPKWIQARTQARRRARAAELRGETPPAVAHRVRPQVLEVRDVEVRFGGVQALKGVSLDVNPGEVVGLMGPNGAGKTTLIDAVTGFTRTRGGTITLDGARIDGLTARRRARAGIGRTFQSLELFDQLTVMENLRTASDPRDAGAYLTDLVHPAHSGLTPAARSAIEMFALGEDLHRVPTELPYGRRRQVAIARAIAAEPSVLLLDEPAAGLDEAETRELAALVRRLVDEWGIGILLVEHDVPMLTTVCDRIVVVDFGAAIATGTPAEIRTDPRVVAAYLGGDADGERSETVGSHHEEVSDVH